MHLGYLLVHLAGDNAFQVELATIVENSFNIHQDGTKLLFREEENPRAKLMAYARNDKLFADGADFDGMLAMYRLPHIKGFTTNPTLMRKAGVSDYEAFARRKLRPCASGSDWS